MYTMYSMILNFDKLMLAFESDSPTTNYALTGSSKTLYKMSEPPPVPYDHILTQFIGTFLPPLSISIAALLKFNLMPFTKVYDFQVITNKNHLSFSNSSNIDITNSLLQEIPPPPLGHVQQLQKDIQTDACS